MTRAYEWALRSANIQTWFTCDKVGDCLHTEIRNFGKRVPTLLTQPNSDLYNSSVTSPARACSSRAPWRSRRGCGYASSTQTPRCCPPRSRSSRCASLSRYTTGQTSRFTSRVGTQFVSDDFLTHASPPQWIVTATVFKRARGEIFTDVGGKNKFVDGTLAVGDDGTVCVRCAGSHEDDVYDVRFRVRGPGEEIVEAGESNLDDDPGNAELSQVSCTCPAAKNVPRAGYAQFGQRQTEGVSQKTQPKGTCKHVVGLLLWRVRMLAAASDPNPNPSWDGGEGRDETTMSNGNANGAGRIGVVASSAAGAAGAAAGTVGGASTNGDAANTTVAARESAPAPPRAAVPSGPKKRRLPPSLVDAAAAAVVEVAKKRKTTTATARVTAHTPPAKPNPKPTPAAAVVVKREPGTAVAPAPAVPVVTPPPGPLPSDAGIIGKVQTVSDDALLAAAERACAPAGVAARTPPRPKPISAAPSAASRGPAAPPPVVVPPVVPPPAAVVPPAPPVVPKTKPFPVVDDLFASFLPVAFGAKTAKPARVTAHTPATKPAVLKTPASAAIAAAPSPGAVPPSVAAPPARVTAHTPAAPSAVVTADPAVVTCPLPAPAGKEKSPDPGPKKMSFAEMMASGGL